MTVDEAVLVQPRRRLQPGPVQAVAKVLAADHQASSASSTSCMLGRESGDWGVGQTGWPAWRKMLGILGPRRSWTASSRTDVMDVTLTPPDRLWRPRPAVVPAHLSLALRHQQRAQRATHPQDPRRDDVLPQAARRRFTFADLGLDAAVDVGGSRVLRSGHESFCARRKTSQCEFVEGDSIDEKVAGPR